MFNLTHAQCGRTPGIGLHRLLAGAVLCVYMSLPQAADDPYLQLLDEEATKVERSSTDTGTGNGGGVSAEDLRMSPSRERFEALLEQQHAGTYSFYRKLPERAREEVFLDYRSGASMDALREKIVDRYLHP